MSEDISRDLVQKLGAAVVERIMASGLPRTTIELFLRRLQAASGNSLLSEAVIQTHGLAVHAVESSSQRRNAALTCLRNGGFALVVLNGGMATRFGGGAKGTVEVAEGFSFLGAKLKDAHRAASCAGAADPPIFLMCSAATHEATLTHLTAHNFFGYDATKVTLFNQCESVRFTPNGDLYKDARSQPSFHGTGHGDLPYCIRKSEAFRSFAQDGQAILLSNVDNALATADLNLLGDFLESEQPVSVEVVDKNPGDVGGAPLLINGKPKLIEAFRLPADFEHERVSVFNTNTFWFRPKVLMDDNIELPWHRIEKRVNGETIIQFERLIGEITHFVDTRFLRVDRHTTDSRFIPVKTPDDLEQARHMIHKTWTTRLP